MDGLYKRDRVHSVRFSFILKVKLQEVWCFIVHVTFYTKPGCALCDEAELMMKLVKEDHPFTWTEIDIRTDDKIHEKYMFMVPVIEKEDSVLLYGSIGYVDIVDLF